MTSCRRDLRRRPWALGRPWAHPPRPVRIRTIPTIRYASTDVNPAAAGPVSYLVLGIVALRGPSTSYDLKRFVQLSIGHFWPFPHTQLYAEPARLAEAGLLEETREESGRRRRFYAITEPGASCSASGSPSRSRPRWSTATSACSSCSSPSSASPEEVQALALEQAEAQRRQLAEYEAIQERFAGPAGARAPPAARSSSAPATGPRRRRVLGGAWLGNRLARTTGATVGDRAAQPSTRPSASATRATWPSPSSGKNGSAIERAATSSQTGNSPGRWPKRSR